MSNELQSSTYLFSTHLLKQFQVSLQEISKKKTEKRERDVNLHKKNDYYIVHDTEKLGHCSY